MANDDFIPSDNLGIQGEVRKVTTGSTTWVVFEFVSPTIPRRPPVLVFHSENREQVFETVDYPRNWRTLPDGELMGLARFD
ncbi:MAG TPA: hypothetical protein VH277_00815 [Gemmatimonadaceae bacterium]|jgi:hypothetical protein|nr:hypothetical protein [Gemmatimonadaceae bacterium]